MHSVLTPKLCFKNFSNENTSSIDGNYFFTAGDYIRIGTLNLLAEEVTNQNIPGELAELGVFQGEFSKYLNELFPDRVLNLFDTFEGFAESDQKLELKQNFSQKQTLERANVSFRNTSIELVMSKMKNPQKIKIYHGYFPDTIPAEEKKFALVSLDCDLYQPILEGLKYFYPRLSTGGYIMIHDYNGIVYAGGVHQAVADFEKQTGHIIKIPIPDACGTLVIGK